MKHRIACLGLVIGAGALLTTGCSVDVNNLFGGGGVGGSTADGATGGGAAQGAGSNNGGASAQGGSSTITAGGAPSNGGAGPGPGPGPGPGAGGGPPGTGGGTMMGTCEQQFPQGAQTAAFLVFFSCGCSNNAPCDNQCSNQDCNGGNPGGGCLNCIQDQVNSTSECVFNAAFGDQCQNDPQCAGYVSCVLNG